MKTARRYAPLLALVALAALLPGAAPAANAAEASGSDSGPALGQPIDLELVDAPVADTLRSFGKVLDAQKVDLDAAISGTVTVHMKEVAVRDALDAVCRSVGCSWTFEGGKLAFVSTLPPLDRAQARLAQPIDLELKDADLAEVLRTFGRISGLAVEVGEGISGKVTVKLDNVPARKALDALCETNHCRWELAVLAAGPRLRFTNAEE